MPWSLPPLNVSQESELGAVINRKIFKRSFPVEGRKLLELFRFCRVCGTAVEKANGSSVCLTAEGRNPIVDFLCGMCWISKRPQIRWEGKRRRANEQQGELNSFIANSSNTLVFIFYAFVCTLTSTALPPLYPSDYDGFHAASVLYLAVI